jgi:hypothetical protein
MVRTLTAAFGRINEALTVIPHVGGSWRPACRGLAAVYLQYISNGYLIMVNVTDTDLVSY